MSTPADTPVADQTVASGSEQVAAASSNGLQSNKSGWDGKLRLDKNKKAVLANPEALSDPDYSDEDAPPVDQIQADEGTDRACLCPHLFAPSADSPCQTCLKTKTLTLRSLSSLPHPNPVMLTSCRKSTFSTAESRPFLPSALNASPNSSSVQTNKNTRPRLIPALETVSTPELNLLDPSSRIPRYHSPRPRTIRQPHLAHQRP
jgi:hypothetical protein